MLDENKCLKANAKSCGECIQAGPNCGWCTNSVSKIALPFHLFFNNVLLSSTVSRGSARQEFSRTSVFIWETLIVKDCDGLK